MSRVILVESGGVKIDPLGGYFFYDGFPHTSHTFTGVDLGPASSSGLLVLGAGAIGALSAVSSITVNGNAASLVISQGSGRNASFYQITGESGVGTVVVNSANAAGQFFLGIWKLRGVQNFTAADTAGFSGGGAVGTLSANIDVPKLGACLGFVAAEGASSGTAWTNLTEDFEVTDGNTGRGSGASLKFNTAQTNLAISAVQTIAGQGRLVLASWR